MKDLLPELLQKLKGEAGWGAFFGGVSAGGHEVVKLYLAQINWAAFAAALAQKTIEVMIVSVVGATFGYLTTRFLKAKFKEK